jgi:hypothetical protein
MPAFLSVRFPKGSQTSCHPSDLRLASCEGGEKAALRVHRGVVLSREDVEAVARRVVQLLQENSMNTLSGPSAVRLVDAATVAAVFGVERDWVYAHAHELGVIRLGGDRGRLRFDL